MSPSQVHNTSPDKTQTEQGFICVEDVFYSPAALNATVGDLFVTNKGIYYVCYRHFSHIGSLGGLAASVFGGLGGGIAAGIGDNMQVEAALKTAATERTKQLGVTMIERLSKNPRSIFIPRDAITHFEADVQSKKIRLSYGDATLEFFSSVSERLATEFREYVAGTAIPSGIHGLDLTFPKPSAFLKSFVSGGDLGIGPSFYCAMSKNRRFLFDLFIAFTSLKDSDKLIVCQGLAGAPRVFSSALTSVILSEVAKQKWKALFSGLGFLFGASVFGLFVLGFFLGGPSKTKTAADEIGSLIIFGLIGSGCLYFAIDGIRKFRSYSKNTGLLLPRLREIGGTESC